MSDLSFTHQFIQRFQCFLNGRHLLIGIAVITKLAKKIGAPVRPVHLIKIDVIRLQALKAALTGRADMLPGQPRPPAQIPETITRPGHLAGDHQIITLATAGQPVAQILLGQALGFCPGWHWIHFSGVDEIDALLHGIVELLKGFLLAVLLAPGHGSQADQADLDICKAKFSRLHGISLQ